jgi:hypothetical protein
LAEGKRCELDNQPGRQWGQERLCVIKEKLKRSILLSKEKLCLYIQESLEHHGGPWKLMIANTSGSGSGE